MLSKRLRVHGLVQGVGFRDFLQVKAKLLGVTGWVRNCSDGSVEALLQGSNEKLESILHWARRGPPAARVTEVTVDDWHEPEVHARFERYPTN